MHYLNGPLSFLTNAADLEKTVNDISLAMVGGASIALIVLVVLASVLNQRLPKLKPWLFGLILIVVLGTTITISGATIFLNIKSATGGPVHWHADFEIWACNNELELRDPHGVLSNKIGTPTLHEHDDKRIHLEGVPVILPDDASLGKFMNVVGGEISSRSLVVPLNDDKYFEDQHNDQDGDGQGAPSPNDVLPFIKTAKDGKYASFANGETCGGKQAQVQLFAYQFDSASKTYKQTKIAQPDRYEIAHHSDIPPGDCLIIEFAPPKDRTDKLCRQYGIRDSIRCQEFGVKPEEHDKVCEIKEVR